MIVKTRATSTGAYALGLVLLCLPQMARGFAAPQPSSRAQELQAISDCRKLENSAARLACFDTAAAALDEAEQHGQVMVVDRQQIRSVQRQAFGFNIPTLSLFGHGGKGESFENISTEVTSASFNRDGKRVIATTEGAVWEQIDDNPLSFEPHRGSKLAIRKASLGSFFCNVDGQPAIRCRRTR